MLQDVALPAAQINCVNTAMVVETQRTKIFILSARCLCISPIDIFVKLICLHLL
jgi:hypothetical protein